MPGVIFFIKGCRELSDVTPGGEPIHKPTVPTGEDHHGGERPAPWLGHPSLQGRYGRRSPCERVTIQHGPPLVITVKKEEEEISVCLLCFELLH